MNIEEVKRLKHGDRVLVEMEVMQDRVDGTVCSCGHVLVRVPGMEDAAASLKPHQIQEKLPRRKYREGDIVRWGDELREVQFFNAVPMVGLFDGGDDPEWCEAEEVTLVCAVEDRTDRKEVSHDS